MTRVRNGHVRGLTPDMAATDSVWRNAVTQNRETASPRVQNAHGRGLTPGLAKRDGA